MLKQKTEPEGWQSNHEGSTDKALYTQLSLSLSLSPSRLLCSPHGPIYGTPRTRVLRFTLGGSFLAIVVPVRGLFRQGRGMLSQLQSFPSVAYLLSLPSLPSPDYTFPRAPASELNCPVRSHFFLLLFSFSKVRRKKKKKKKIGKRNRERSSRGYLRRLIRL